MPIYEYRCSACERVTEEWVRSFDSPDEMACPHCGKPARRIVSNTSFQLKGGGWYVTDYGSHKNVPHDSGASTAESSAAAPVESATAAQAVPATTAAQAVPAAQAATAAQAVPAATAAPAAPAASPSPAA